MMSGKNCSINFICLVSEVDSSESNEGSEMNSTNFDKPTTDISYSKRMSRARRSGAFFFSRKLEVPHHLSCIHC